MKNKFIFNVLSLWLIFFQLKIVSGISKNAYNMTNVIEKSYQYTDMLISNAKTDEIVIDQIKKNIEEEKQFFTQTQLTNISETENNYLENICAEYSKRLFDRALAADSSIALKNSDLYKNCLTPCGHQSLQRQLIGNPALTFDEEKQVVKSQRILLKYFINNCSQREKLQNLVERSANIHNKLKDIIKTHSADLIAYFKEQKYNEEVKKNNWLIYAKNFLKMHGPDILLTSIPGICASVIKKNKFECDKDFFYTLKDSLIYCPYNYWWNDIFIFTGIGLPQSYKQLNNNCTIGLSVVTEGMNSFKYFNIINKWNKNFDSCAKNTIIINGIFNYKNIDFVHPYTFLVFYLGRIFDGYKSKKYINAYNNYKRSIIVKELISLYCEKINVTKEINTFLNSILEEKKEIVIHENEIISSMIASAKFTNEYVKIVTKKNALHIPLTLLLPDNFIVQFGKNTELIFTIDYENIKLINSYFIETCNELIGFVDALNSKLKTLEQDQENYCIPEINFNAQGNDEELILENFYLPITQEHSIKNTICLNNRNNVVDNDTYNNVIIVSQYGSGKTYTLRSVLNALYWSNLGIVPASKCVMPYFGNRIMQNISSSNYKASSKMSKHMAENKFMRSVHETLKNCDMPSIVLMDELYSGTTPSEQTKLVEEFVVPLLKKDNCYSIFTTHYPENVELLFKKEFNIGMYYILVEKIKQLDGSVTFNRTFKLVHDKYNNDQNNWWLRPWTSDHKAYREYMIEVEDSIMKKNSNLA
jgi:hypothetical protein